MASDTANFTAEDIIEVFKLDGQDQLINIIK